MGLPDLSRLQAYARAQTPQESFESLLKATISSPDSVIVTVQLFRDILKEFFISHQPLKEISVLRGSDPDESILNELQEFLNKLTEGEKEQIIALFTESDPMEEDIPDLSRSRRKRISTDSVRAGENNSDKGTSQAKQERSNNRAEYHIDAEKLTGAIPVYSMRVLHCWTKLYNTLRACTQLFHKKEIVDYVLKANSKLIEEIIFHFLDSIKSDAQMQSLRKRMLRGTERCLGFHMDENREINDGMREHLTVCMNAIKAYCTEGSIHENQCIISEILHKILIENSRNTMLGMWGYNPVANITQETADELKSWRTVVLRMQKLRFEPRKIYVFVDGDPETEMEASVINFANANERYTSISLNLQANSGFYQKLWLSEVEISHKKRLQRSVFFDAIDTDIVDRVRIFLQATKKSNSGMHGQIQLSTILDALELSNVPREDIIRAIEYLQRTGFIKSDIMGTTIRLGLV